MRFGRGLEVVLEEQICLVSIYLYFLYSFSNPVPVIYLLICMHKSTCGYTPFCCCE